MRKTTIALPYGKKSAAFSVDSHRLLGVLRNRFPAREDVRILLERALGGRTRALIGRILSERKRVLLVVPDSTRKAHLKEIIPSFLRHVPPSCAADIIVGTGLHKPHSRRELQGLLGAGVCGDYHVVSHNQKRENLKYFGVTRKGVPIVLNRAVEGCDGIVSIGVIEPHLYAGYSGCAKTIAMGIAGERTINVTHHPRFLDDEGVAVGSIESNPFQSTLWDIVRRLPFLFALNVVNDHDGNAVEVFAGEPRDVFERGVAFARRVYALEVGRRADVVVCGVGHPKDVNLYQASRAINYVVNSPRPILREGGFLVVVAEMRDGLGDGIGERRCFKALRSMRSPEGFIEEIKAHGCLGGEHRAYMIAKAMAKAKVIVVGERAPQIMRGLPMVAFKTIAEAMRYVEKAAGRESTVYVVPRALSTVVSVRG